MVEQEPKTQITRTEFEARINEATTCLWEGWRELGLGIEPGDIIDGEVLDEVDADHIRAEAENVLRDMLNSVAEVVEEKKQ